MSAPSQALKPVKGSVRVDVVVDVVVAAVVVAVGVAVAVVVLAVVAAVEPDAIVPVEPDEAPDDDDEDPELWELCEPELPEPVEPPSGSTYCWSPAEGPEASATAGGRAARPSAMPRTMKTRREERTPRVLRTRSIERVHRSPQRWPRRAQTGLLQDLLQDQELPARRRRVVLGC